MYAIKFPYQTKHFQDFSRTTFTFKCFQGLDFATFKFEDFQGPECTLEFTAKAFHMFWQC